MSDEIKYILPVSQYNTANTLDPITDVKLNGFILNSFHAPLGLAPINLNGNLGSVTLSEEDKKIDKIKKIAIYSASGIAILISIILLVKTFRK